MKKRLTHCDIKQDHWYKVIKAPDHWDTNRYSYGVLGKVGKCQWCQPIHGASLLFNNCLQRLVQPDCLESAEEPLSEQIKAALEIPVDLNMSEKNDIKIGNIYLVTKEPHFYDREGYRGRCPVVGRFGKAVAVRGEGCLLFFGHEKKQHFIPFDCLHDAGEEPVKKKKEIPDGLLIKAMIMNPEGVLKIIKGLAKMTKDYSLKTLLERGTIV